jgi:hypothetical protein
MTVNKQTDLLSSLCNPEAIADTLDDQLIPKVERLLGAQAAQLLQKTAELHRAEEAKDVMASRSVATASGQISVKSNQGFDSPACTCRLALVKGCQDRERMLQAQVTAGVRCVPRASQVAWALRCIILTGRNTAATTMAHAQVARMEAAMEEERLRHSLVEHQLQQQLVEERLRAERMRASRDDTVQQRDECQHELAAAYAELEAMQATLADSAVYVR